MKKLFYSLVVIFSVLSLAMSVTACFDSGDNSSITGGTSSESQITSESPTEDESEINADTPVYRGMTAGDARTEYSSFSARMLMQAPPAPPHDDEHPWYCYHCKHYHGDYRGDHDHFPFDHPFDYDHDHNGKIDDDEKKDDIDDVANDLVDGANASIYYTEQNTDFYVTIHLNNPRDFEILSFTLNGKRYSSYMFESGSDMENLVLKLNVGDKHGVLDYTIDEIKYVDGTQIKNVIMKGDKTVRVGVHVENSVSADIYNKVISYNSISFNANIEDTDNLIDFSDGEIHAVLYDGDSLIEDRKISANKANEILFDNLIPDTIYQYAVIAYYDDFDNNGFSTHVLYKEAIVTDYLVLFDDIVVSSDGISFSFAGNDSVSPITIVNACVIRGENLIGNIPLDNLTVSGLLSETEYILKAEFNLAGKTYDISLYFTTLAKGIPSVSVTNLQPTADSVSFDVNVIDEDNVGEISKIELIDEDKNAIVAENTYVRAFSGLLSDKSYILKITYAYDPNTGDTSEVVTQAVFRTKAKSAPTFEFGDLSSAYNRMSADYTVTDNDKTITDFYIGLYDGDVLIGKSTALSESIFENLKCGYNYTVKAVITYNLNNGGSDIVATKTAAAATPVYKDANGVHYAVTANDEAIVTGYDKGITDAIFESSVCGYPVTKVQQSVFGNCQTLKNIVFPSTMAEIEQSAFDSCQHLETVEFNEGLKTIGYRAFYCCSEVKKVVIPSSVENIGEEGVNFGVYNSNTTLFAYWSGDWFGDDRPAGWNYNYAVNRYSENKWGEDTVFDFKEFISDGTFTYALKNDGTLIVVEYLTPENSDIVIPSYVKNYTVTEIGIRCFEDVRVSSLILPEKLEKISKCAFYYSDNWNYSTTIRLSFPTTLKEIGKYAFRRVNYIQSVKFNSTPSIGESAFEDCTFTSIDFPLVYPDEYDDYYFDSEMVSGVIERFAFSNCYYLTWINIPANYDTIEDNVFENCPNIQIASLAERRRDSWHEHFASTAPTIYWKSYIAPNGIIYCVNDEIKYNEHSTLSVTGYLGSDFETIILDEINGKIVTVIKTDAFFDSTANTIYYPHTIQVFGERCFGVYDNGDNKYGTPYYGTYNGFAYTIDEENKTASIIRYVGNEENPIVPETINGYKVISVKIDSYQLSPAETDGLYFLGSESNPYFVLFKVANHDITRCSIPEGTKIIADSAFHYCPNLESIELPESLEFINYDAFSSCPRLIDITNRSSIAIEKGSTENGSIGRNALSVHKTADDSDVVFTTTDDGLVFASASETTILFKYIGTKSKIVLPDYINGNVYDIFQYAFSGNKSLSDITIADAVTKIGDDAFAGCSELSKVVIGNGVKTIGIWAFSRCDKLSEVKLGNSIEDMPYNIFPSEGDFLTEENGIYYLDNWVYKSSPDITVANIREGTIGIAEYAFKDRTSLTTVTLPEGLKYISDYAFNNCPALKEINYPDSILKIGNLAFADCKSLKSAILPNGIKKMGGYVFSNCPALENVSLPSSLSEIDSGVFKNCTSLKAIVIPANVMAINAYVFSGCKNLKSVTFENPNGWRYYDRISSSSTPSYTRLDVSDPIVAAKWLTDEFNTWYYAISHT